MRVMGADVRNADALASAASLAIVLAALVLSINGWLPITLDKKQWLPFVSCLVGVTLYTLSAVKKRRDRFDLRYLPDYLYRAAQAMVYLYVILAVGWQKEGAVLDFERWPPNLWGLLVGLFIEHVEKAMEGLGQRFEEVLAGILPRALDAPTSRERQLGRVRLEQRFREIQTQAEMLLPQLRSPAVREALRAQIDGTLRTLREGDEKAIEDEIRRLALDFEQLKQAAREEDLTVGEILAGVRGAGAAARRSRGQPPTG